MEEDKDIKVLEERKAIQFIKSELEDEKIRKDYKQLTGLYGNKEIEILLNSIENLIKRNKELQEYQHKVNEIMNFDEENLDSSRVNNNYIGLKNCATQLKKQVEDSIPKSKVREKIEKLKIRIDYLKTELNKIYIKIEKGTETDIDNLSILEYYYKKELYYRERQKDILQELLQDKE